MQDPAVYDQIEKVSTRLYDGLEKIFQERGLEVRGSGIYQIPLPCKQGSISYAHTEKDIDRTLEITREVLSRL